MSFRRPLFFLLVDSWLVSAGCAGVVVFAGGVALESVEAPVLPAGCAVSVAVAVPLVTAGVASAPVGVSPGGLGSAFGLPGVIVSTVAVLPTLEVAAAFAFGCKLKPMVSSPDSLA